MGRAGRKQLKEVTLNSRRFCVLSFWPAKKEVFALSRKSVPSNQKKMNAFFFASSSPNNSPSALSFLFFSFLREKRQTTDRKK
jgi:hypothetical protein